MPYHVIIQPRIRRQIAHWPMPDTLIVECYLRINSLSDFPARQLVRAEQPFEGMVLSFDIIDPVNRLAVHHFLFQAVYGTNEETLFIEAAAHNRFTVGE